MSDLKRVRRTALLCLYCIGNIACYRAGWADQGDSQLRVQRDFWVRANGNFLDIAVLEWCKLFAEKDGKHHWSRVLPEKSVFREGLFDEVAMTSRQFATELKVVKTYRDKYVAHLDDPAYDRYPTTEFLRRSASYLYEALVEHAEAIGHPIGAPWSAQAFYEERYADASAEVTAALTAR